MMMMEEKTHKESWANLSITIPRKSRSTLYFCINGFELDDRWQRWDNNSMQQNATGIAACCLNLDEAARETQQGKKEERGRAHASELAWKIDYEWVDKMCWHIHLAVTNISFVSALYHSILPCLYNCMWIQKIRIKQTQHGEKKNKIWM